MPQVVYNEIIDSGRFQELRAPAWRHIPGIVSYGGKGKPTATEMTTGSGLDYKVEKVPLFAQIEGANFETPVYALYKVEEGKEPVYLGKVSRKYQVVQNMEIANIIDPITKVFPADSVGTYGNGRLAFWILKAESFTIAGDQIDDFFTVVDIKDGGHALAIMETPVRMICGNMYRLAVKKATTIIRLNHAYHPAERLEAVAKTVELMQEGKHVVMSILEDMTKKKVSKAMLDKICDRIYPLPDIASLDPATAPISKLNHYKNWFDANTKIREGLKVLYDRFNDTYPIAAGTAYALYNAVVEMEDYRDGRGVYESAMFGSRATNKKRAFEMLMVR